jgi:hypothetical protein
VFIPKYRKKAIFGQIWKEPGETFHRMAKQKECTIEEGHLMSDQVETNSVNAASSGLQIKAPGFAGGYLL